MDNSRLRSACLALLLVACQAEPNPQPAPTPPPAGGTAVIADWEAPSSFAVLSAGTQADLRAGALAFAPLWEIAPDRTARPALVTSIPTTTNGGVKVVAGHTVVSVLLRHGLRWSDGAPLTAADAAFTWAAISKPGSGVSLAPGLDHVSSVLALSDRLLEITFSGPFAPYLLSGAQLRPMPQHRLADVPAASWASSQFFQLPDAVSGPFKPESLKPGTEARLLRNPLFGGAGGPAHLDGIVYRAYSGHDAELAALAAGEADLGLHLSAADLPELSAQSGARPLVVPGFRQEFLNPNHAAPLWAGPDGRVLLEALSMSIDRRRLVDLLIPEAKPQSDLSGIRPAPAPDPEGAARALDAAGWLRSADAVRANAGRRFSFELLAACDSPLQAAELDFLKRTWAALGAEARTGCRDRRLLLGGFAEGGLNATGGFEMSLYSFSPAPDPSGWAPLGISGQIPSRQLPGGENWNRCSDSAIDGAFGDVEVALRPADRVAAYRRAEEAWVSYHCTIPLFTAPAVAQVATRLHGVRLNPALQLETWAAEGWWLG